MGKKLKKMVNKVEKYKWIIWFNKNLVILFLKYT